MSKKQKKAIKRKIDEFLDMNTPGGKAMKIGKELLEELYPKKELQLNMYQLKPKTTIMQQLKTKIKYHLDKIKKIIWQIVFFDS